MVGKSLVSVLVPCYNAERWLDEMFRSVLGQTWKHIEIVVVDDGSQDGSLKIAESYRAGNVKVISQLNAGACVARNVAYAHSQGEFIQYLDADDFLSPDKIEEQMHVLDSSPPNVLAVSATMHFYDGENPNAGVFHDGWPMVDSDNPREWLIDMYGPERGGMVQPGAWLTPRALADAVGPWNEELNRCPNDDGEYFSRVVLRCEGIRRSRRGLNYYRKFKGGGSLSGKKSKVHLQGSLNAQNLICEALLAGGQEEATRKSLARQYKELAFMAYPFAPAVTEMALAKASELEFGDFQPHFPTAKGRMIAQLLGWRLARRLNVFWHSWRSAKSR